MIHLNDVFKAIARERAYQNRKWGTVETYPHDVSGWLLILQSELNEAKEAWVKGFSDDDALQEVLQVIAVGVACLQQHGIVERTWVTRSDDIEAIERRKDRPADSGKKPASFEKRPGRTE